MTADLQTVFVSNRNIKQKDRNNEVFGNQFNRKHTLRLATVAHGIKSSCLSLVEAGLEREILANIAAQADDGKPWIFFLHGNNQSLAKSLKVSQRIGQQYNANMIIFSWPSFEYNPHFKSGLALSTTLSVFPITQPLAALALNRTISRKKKQYLKARKAAVNSVDHFVEAFELLRDELLLPLRAKKNPPHISFLVHSLGNFLLQNILEQQAGALTGFKFDDAMLHQADVEAQNHDGWLSNFPLAANDRIHITRSRKDSVLFLSAMVNNHMNIKKAFTRLGNRRDNSSEKSPFNYIDFTSKDGVGLSHGVAWSKRVSEEVVALCRPVLTGC